MSRVELAESFLYSRLKYEAFATPLVIPLMSRVRRWGFGGGETAPENLLFRPWRATKSPSMGEIKVSWRANALQTSPKNAVAPRNITHESLCRAARRVRWRAVSVG